MKLLFFEDEFLDDLSKSFYLSLRIEIPDLKVVQAANTKRFEQELKKSSYDVFVLDIMTADSYLKGLKTNKNVSSANVGIELVERIRTGYYKGQKTDALIIMRTARATEPVIRERCRIKGADFCFSPGADDEKILSVVKRLFRDQNE